MGLSLKNLTPTAVIEGPESSAYASRMMQLEICDNAGYSSDTLRITLNTESFTHNIQKGHVLRALLGYKESESLYDMGAYTIAKLKPLYFPNRIEVLATANALHINAPSKARRSESYSGLTLMAIVTKLAGRMGLKAKVHTTLANEVFVHIDQKNESDLSFCQRLASYNDAVVKAYDGDLIFAPRGQLKNQSGEDMEPIELLLADSNATAPFNALKSLELQLPEREQFMGVESHYYDDEKAEAIAVKVGSEPRAILPGRYTNESEATKAAKSELSRIKRQSLNFSFSVPGNPELMAERLISITGAGNLADGLASCDTIRHVVIPGSDFTTYGTASAIIKRA